MASNTALPTASTNLASERSLVTLRAPAGSRPRVWGAGPSTEHTPAASTAGRCFQKEDLNKHLDRLQERPLPAPGGCTPHLTLSQGPGQATARAAGAPGRRQLSLPTAAQKTPRDHDKVTQMQRQQDPGVAAAPLMATHQPRVTQRFHTQGTSVFGAGVPVAKRGSTGCPSMGAERSVHTRDVTQPRGGRDPETCPTWTDPEDTGLREGTQTRRTPPAGPHSQKVPRGGPSTETGGGGSQGRGLRVGRWKVLRGGVSALRAPSCALRDGYGGESHVTNISPGFKNLK
ncbi:uncharacterized protein LOC119864790 isoform X5 [Canis lupus familiaris]|uniref:uncharacterized protein LOC119864790 isoform X5 n=1 Tax=Canis lupus familiaris TaxID=9615 RepID=UPI0018F6B617|nr:uncharacterized protein LOC119864790 isoform X5 [Canis lupus familiaris]